MQWMCNKLYMSLSITKKKTTTTVPLIHLIHRSTCPLIHYHNHQCHQITTEFVSKKNNIYIYINSLNQLNSNSNDYMQNINLIRIPTKWNQSKSKMESQPNRIESINKSNQSTKLIKTIDQQFRLQMIHHLVKSHACVCVCPATVSVLINHACTHIYTCIFASIHVHTHTYVYVWTWLSLINKNYIRTSTTTCTTKRHNLQHDVSTKHNLHWFCIYPKTFQCVIPIIPINELRFLQLNA